MVVVAVLGVVVGALLTWSHGGWADDATMIRLGRVLIGASILLAVVVVAASPIAAEVGGEVGGEVGEVRPAPSPVTSGFVPGRLPPAFLN